MIYSSTAHLTDEEYLALCLQDKGVRNVYQNMQISGQRAQKRKAERDALAAEVAVRNSGRK